MGNLRILIVGSDQEWSIERFYVKYIRQEGYEVELFSAQNIFYDYYNRTIFHKLFFKTGFSGIYKHINQQLIQKASEFKPDIIWIFKGMEILPTTLNALRHTGIKLVNYNPDNPFIFSGKGSGNSNVYNSIYLYDLFFTYNKEIEERLMNEYKVRTSYLPFGFDISEELYQQCNSQEEKLKCCFLGNPDEQRASFIQALGDSGIPIDVYGNYWAKFVSQGNISIYPPVYGDEFYKILYKYRVQLNMMRPHNLRSHNMRTFEIPAISGIQVAPDTPEHRLFFENGEEIFLYSTAEECIKLIRVLLSMDSHRIRKIRVNSRMRCVGGRYSYHERAKYVLTEMSRL